MERRTTAEAKLITIQVRIDQAEDGKEARLMELYDLGTNIHGQDLRHAIDQMDRDYKWALFSDRMEQKDAIEELEEVATKVREVLGKEFVLVKEEQEEE